MPKTTAVVDHRTEDAIELPPTLVSVISTQGQACLIEWVDGVGRPRRAFVPAAAVIDSRCVGPAAGLAYGDDWEGILGTLSVTPDAVADELRRRGIWTREDARRNPTMVMSALQAAYGLDLARLLAD